MWRRFNRYLAKYVSSANKNAGKFLILIVSAALAAAFYGSKLELKSDLKELLPPKSASVKALDRMIKQIGGTGLLVVAVEGPNLAANKKFMDDLAAKLAEFPKDKVRFVSYRVDEIEKFYERYALHYVPVSDLAKVRSDVKRRVELETIKMTPMYLDLMEDDEPAEKSFSFDTEKLKKSFEDKKRFPLSTIDGYFGGEWGRLLVMLIRPYGASLSVDSAKKLLADVRAIASGLKPEAYDPQLKVGYCGDVVSTVEEYDTLKTDILDTALLCFVLVGGIIALYFLRVRALAFIASTLVIALCFTAALVNAAIGFLNAQTAFLGSVIVGTGVNYGIMLFARYLEERKRGRSAKGSMVRAANESFMPTFLAAATTAVSFSVLAIARIRGLSQFGFIGAVGVMCCWAMTFLYLPPLVLFSERFQALVKRPAQMPSRRSAVMDVISRVASKSPWFIVGTSIIIAMVFGAVIFRYAPRSIEYDFTRMRNIRSVEDGTEALEKRVSRLFQSSMTPAVVISDDPLQSMAVCDAVSKLKNNIPAEENRIGSCSSIYDLMPPKGEDEQRMREIKSIQNLLAGKWREKIPASTNLKIVDALARLSVPQPTLDDLPTILSSPFTDLSGKRGVVSYISPRPGMLLSDGRNLIKFADQISKVRLADNKRINVAAASLVFADLVRIIKEEAPVLTIASLLGVMAFVFLTLRRSWLGTIIMLTILWSSLMMLGIGALMGLKVNFFNFIVLPLTFGVGADYGINVAVRLSRGKLSIASAMRHTGGAVALCSATTVIGYYVLTLASNQALKSFGLLAVIGEICCLFSAVVIIPAAMSLRKAKV